MASHIPSLVKQLVVALIESVRGVIRSTTNKYPIITWTALYLFGAATFGLVDALLI